MCLAWSAYLTISICFKPLYAIDEAFGDHWGHCPRDITRGWDSSGPLERVMGIEPTSSAWKADILAVVRHPHKMKAQCKGKLSFHGDRK